MKELMDKWDSVSVRSIADMCAATEESSEIFNEMWDFAKKNGFVNKNGVIFLNNESIEIYKNYGCLAHEKMIVYTYGSPEETAKCYDKITVKIPDGWETFENYMGETILTAPLGKNYTIHEVLCGDEYPCFRTFGNGDRIKLEVMDD